MSIKIYLEILRVALVIKALNCCGIWFYDVMSVRKSVKFLKVGKLSAGTFLNKKLLFSIKKCNF